MHVVYFSSAFSLVHGALSRIFVDSDGLTKVISTGDAESLVFASLATILVELSFLSQVRITLIFQT